VPGPVAATLMILVPIAIVALHVFVLRRQMWLRLAAGASRDAVVIVDRKGRVVFWNKAAERLFGYAEKEILGRGFELLLAPQPRRAVVRRLLRLRGPRANAAERQLMEAVGQRKDGSEFPIEITASVAGARWRRSWRGIGVVRDISRLREGEAESRRAMDRAEGMADELAAVNRVMEQTTVWANEMAAQAAMANAAKSEFLASMSHEIRTPMNGVLGMLTLLEQTTLTHEQLDCVETIRFSGQALLDIINQILDFSRIESGKLDLEQMEFDPRHQVEQAVALFAERAEAKGIELVALVSDAVPARLIGDPGRFRQIVINLLGNAVKFTERGEVGVDLQLVSREGDRASLSIEVHDTGIGMAPDVVTRLFQPFYQGDGGTRRKFGGTGLGLAISKRLAEAMNGKVEAFSERGRGSRFRCTVEIGVMAGALETPSLPPELAGAGALVVHRNASMRKMLAYYAGAWGLTTEEVANGSAAVEAVQKGRWRFVIADSADPDLCLLREALAASNGGSGQPALALLVWQSQGSSPSGISADAFVTKPVRGARLREALLGVVQPADQGPASLLRLASAVAQSQAPLDRTANYRVLVAEDNAVNQKVARRLLEKLGYAVDVVPDGGPAVQAAATGQYAAVLMDCQMPGMDGFRATQSIRRLEGASRLVPVIAMTANAMKGDREKCIEAGMTDYITKPVDLTALKSALERWCGQTHPASPAERQPDVAPEGVFEGQA